MARHQISHRLAIHRIKIQPLRAAVGELHADLDVILARHGFTGIMQQQRQVKQFRLFEFTLQLGKALVPFRFRFFQTMQMFDCQKRMLIHRVAMVKIPHHQRLNPFQLRQQKSQEAKRVHGAQSVGRMGLQQRFLQVKPQLGAPRRRRRQRRQRLLDFIFGRRAQFQAMFGHEVKKPQQHFRIAQPSWLLEKDQSIHHREVRACDPRTPALELPVQGRPGCRNLLQQLVADAVHAAHVAKVDTHPVGCVRDFKIAGADLSRRCFVLRLPGECVIVTPIAEVQKATH